MNFSNSSTESSPSLEGRKEGRKLRGRKEGRTLRGRKEGRKE
jgi:hypothetical protein